MPDYSKGKIYQVISPNHPVPYIGSTTVALSKRMAEHRAKRDCSARIVIDAGDAYIELIEEFPCDNKEQLNKREGELIRERQCVNRCMAGRTRKEHYQDHRLENLARRKAYHEANREADLARLKAWYEKNKDTLNTRRREAWAKKKAQSISRCITTPPEAVESILLTPADPST